MAPTDPRKLTELIFERIQSRWVELGFNSDEEVSLKARPGRKELVRNIKRGHVPRADNLDAIAKVLQCSNEYLLGNIDTPELPAAGHNNPPCSARELLAQLDDINAASIEALRDWVLGEDGDAARRQIAAHKVEAEKLRRRLSLD